MSFRQDFTFERFIVTPSTAAAYHAAVAVTVDQPGGARVLQLYGPSGAGKTHLLHAIAQATAARLPNGRLKGVRTSDLISQLVEAVRRDDTATLHEEYAKVDLLVLDDVQGLMDRPAIQTEVGRLVQRCVEGGARIVAASGVPPADLPALAATLRSNTPCQWVALKRRTEDESHRLAAALLARQSLTVSEGLVTRLVRDSGGDVRRLIGAVVHLSARQSHGKVGPPWLAGRRRASPR